MCKSLVEELEAAIAKVDPKKKIETGTFRLDGAGSQTKTLVSDTHCCLRSMLGRSIQTGIFRLDGAGSHKTLVSETN